MVSVTINGKTVKVPAGISILAAAEKAGVEIPHLCYLEGVNEIGACRLCCVEIEGEHSLVPACENKVRNGMVVRTDTPRVLDAVKTNLELILSRHNSDCPSCVRNGSCQLQKLAKQFGLDGQLYEKKVPCGNKTKWNTEFPLIRDESKCIKCMRCIQVCSKIQSLGIWDLKGAGGRTSVGVTGGLEIENAPCSLCGQCITHCPVGALRERDDVDKVIAAIANPDVTTVVQIAPAVRASWGEALGLKKEKATVNLIAAALRRAGFDFVFDTCFSADLTIMEEGTEFLKRFNSGNLSEYPMFTSCCPGWVRFVKAKYPMLVKQLSTAKSPQQMFGSIIKTYFAQSRNLEAKNIFSVSIMPCTAKKAESEMSDEIDAVLTTRELVRLITRLGIDVSKLEESKFDSLMETGTGAGVIFGASGGVMEAALRSAYYLVTGKNCDADAFVAIRENSDKYPWREAEFNLSGTPVRVAVASSLGNADKLCKAIVNGEVKYDFVEIMACPGGCAGGGGQIINGDDVERAGSRSSVLYGIDKNSKLRFSHENPDVRQLYDSFLGKPLSEKAEALLHVGHTK